MGISFRRQECNFNPLSMISGQGIQQVRGNSGQKATGVNSNHAQASDAHYDNESSENLLSQQETNPMQQIGNINELNIENIFNGDDSDSPTELNTVRQSNGMTNLQRQ